VSWSHYRGERDPYAAVMAAWRISIERAFATAQGREFPRAARVLIAAHHHTASRSKLWDAVFLAQLAELAQIAGDVDEKHTADFLHMWDRRGALIWQPSTKKGEPSWIGLPGSMARQLPLLGVATEEPELSTRGATKDGLGGPLSDRNRGLSGPPDEKRRERPRAGLANEHQICVVCDHAVGLDGVLEAGVWWCPVHAEAAA
jgi:hypothetical protein